MLDTKHRIAARRRPTARTRSRSITSITLAAAALGLLAASAPVNADEPTITRTQVDEITTLVDAGYGSLLALYKDLHTHPELSRHEVRTAGKVADALAEAGYEVTRDVGGNGIVALMRNGPGSAVMVRCDLDALPIEEKTGLPYASTVTTKNDAGDEVHVMHACGHDVHATVLVGVARVMAKLRDQWHGTLMLIGQPAEEIGRGAQSMLKDGLFTRFVKPDYALALHVDAMLEAGRVTCGPGYMLANVDSFDIVIRGRGGHGAAPHKTIDPVLLACRTVVALQSIVSREIKPIDDAVITVGSIHGGTKHNIIPDEVRLQLTVRSYKDDVRKQLHDAIKRITFGVAASAGAPEPSVKVSEGVSSTYNDPALAARCAAVFERVVGKDHVEPGEPVMGGEDFSYYGRAGVPAVMYRLGAVAAQRMERSRQPDGEALPSLHSNMFAPQPELTIKTGVRTMSAVVLDLMAK